MVREANKIQGTKKILSSVRKSHELTRALVTWASILKDHRVTLPPQYHIQQGSTGTTYLPSLAWGVSELGVVLCLGRGRGRRFLVLCDVFGAEERKLVNVVLWLQKKRMTHGSRFYKILLDFLESWEICLWGLEFSLSSICQKKSCGGLSADSSFEKEHITLF